MSPFGSHSSHAEDAMTQSAKEIAVLKKLDMLLKEARTSPVHSMLDEILSSLKLVLIEARNELDGEMFFDVHGSVSPITVDKIFSYLEQIITCITPVHMSDCFDKEFTFKIELLRKYGKTLALEIEDEISVATSGMDHECRLGNLFGCISKLAANAFRAAIIRGGEKSKLWSRLVHVADLDGLLPKEEEPCCICMSVIINKEANFVILSGCRHLLCESCGWTWFEFNSACPMCRLAGTPIIPREAFIQFKEEQRELEARFHTQTL